VEASLELERAGGGPPALGAPEQVPDGPDLVGASLVGNGMTQLLEARQRVVGLATGQESLDGLGVAVEVHPGLAQVVVGQDVERIEPGGRPEIPGGFLKGLRSELLEARSTALERLRAHPLGDLVAGA
jgi:hypothetical protein